MLHYHVVDGFVSSYVISTFHLRSVISNFICGWVYSILCFVKEMLSHSRKVCGFLWYIGFLYQ